jgi:hypothetical protein
MKPNNIIIFIIYCLLFLIYFSCNTNNTEDSNPGPILLISERSGSSQLYSMEKNGSNAKQLTFDEEFPVYDAKWSGDGKYICYNSPNISVKLVISRWNTLYIMNSDLSSKKMLIKNLYYSETIKANFSDCMSIAWSSDSKNIYYRRIIESGNNMIFGINNDGSNEKVISNLSNEWASQRPLCFLNENTLLCMANSNEYRDSLGKIISTYYPFIIDMNGNITKTYKSPGVQYEGIIIDRKNENIIAGISYGRPVTGYELVLMDINFNRKKALYTSDKYITPVAFSEDEKEVLVYSSDINIPNYSKIFLISVDGSSMKTITPSLSGVFVPVDWRK